MQTNHAGNNDAGKVCQCNDESRGAVEQCTASNFRRLDGCYEAQYQFGSYCSDESATSANDSHGK